MKNLISIIILIILQTGLLSDSIKLENRIQVGLTFGEIPFLAKSFKPGISIKYNFTEELSVGCTWQYKDNLQRDQSSFNADNGLEGLTSSKETTDIRMLVSINYRPTKWSPYLIAGFVYNGEDIETMQFDTRDRLIGSKNYNTNIKITQSRDSGFKPAFGLGYQYDIDENYSSNISMAMAFFDDISNQNIEIESDKPFLIDDKNFLIQKMRNVYKNNFHNKYHIFNLGGSYKFEL